MVLLKKIYINILVIVRGIIWLVFSRSTRKLSKIIAAYKYGGLELCWNRAVAKFSGFNLHYDPKRYQLSKNQCEFLTKQFANKPLISIVTPVYKIDTNWLDKCIKSVFRQCYKNWEIVLVDDASENDEIKKTMENWASRDNRIKVFFQKTNRGIAGATNFAIKQAQGEFIGFLDHDDELTPDALTWMVWAINKHPEALWFYSDEDKISSRNDCYEPHLKPDFSPELLLSNMFTCHFSIYSSKIISQVNSLRMGFDGSQDHDLALRISEIVHQSQVIHIPRILYHWRAIPGSAAMLTDEKPKAPASGRKAVRDALVRRNLKGKVTSNKICPTLYMIEFEPASYPEVTLIIPTKNSLDLMKKCLDSIKRHTKYPNYDIIVIDNQSDDKECIEYLKKKESESIIKIIKYDKPFNHSDMNNLAVESVDSEFIVFMNNDIEIITDNWLEQLVATAMIDETIACVGCMLLNEDMTVQHGGIILGLNYVVGHSHRDYPEDSGGYFGRMHALQEISGVTAALSIIRKSAFKAVGGFNSERYPTSFNDVDLAIRFKQMGFRSIYNPMIKAFHHESRTRFIGPEEIKYQQRIREDYSDIIYNDPFYNPNLTLNNEQFNGFRHFPIEEQIVELRNLKNRLKAKCRCDD